MQLLDMKQEQKAALNKAEALLGADGHVMTVAEAEGYETAMARIVGPWHNHQGA